MANKKEETKKEPRYIILKLLAIQIYCYDSYSACNKVKYS